MRNDKFLDIHIVEYSKIRELEKLTTMQGVELANKYIWGLSNFKRFVSQFLKTENNEDQWIFDYKSYCLYLTMLNKDTFLKYLHPINWASEYYQERWDNNKMNKCIKSIGKIAQNIKI